MEEEEEDGWRRKRRRRRRRKKGKGGKEEEEEEEERVMKRLQEESSELQSSDFWDSVRSTILEPLRKHLAPPEDPLASFGELSLEPGTPEGGRESLCCVCYGVGNFASCAKARMQMALLLLALEELEIPRHRCHVFDPAFSAAETETLGRLGFVTIAENEEGKRQVTGPTVFYMVHCGKALYNNLLWRNWSPRPLSKMAVIGNSFRGVEERMPTKIFQKEYGYIAKILGATTEEPFPPHPRYLDVFNDTAAHVFPSLKLCGLPAEIWATPEEPLYCHEEHLEIIRKEPPSPPRLPVLKMAADSGLPR